MFVALEGRPEDYIARLEELISTRRVGVSVLDEEGDSDGHHRLHLHVHGRGQHHVKDHVHDDDLHHDHSR